MGKAVICVGVSASGKSTWTRDFIHSQSKAGVVWREINRDWERRCVLFDKTQGQIDGLVWKLWKWKWEDEVTARCDARLAKAVEEKANVVVSDTNLHAGRRTALIKRLEAMGYTVEIKVFEVDFAEACRRDAARENGVGVAVIAQQFKQFNKEFVQQYTGTPGKAPAVLVDIDGTLAEMVGRGAFDWHRVGEDKPKAFVHSVVRGLKDQGFTIVVMSGRDGNDECREKTLKWLHEHKVPFDELFMRAAGDSRKDSIVKAELFWEHVAPYYDAKMVIDDRLQVCRMWRGMGLEVMQVGDPYVEF